MTDNRRVWSVFAYYSPGSAETDHDWSCTEELLPRAIQRVIDQGYEAIHLTYDGTVSEIRQRKIDASK